MSGCLKSYLIKGLSITLEMGISLRLLSSNTFSFKNILDTSKGLLNLNMPLE